LAVVIRACDDVALARVLFTEYLEGTLEETGLPDPEDSPGALEMMRRDIERLPEPYEEHPFPMVFLGRDLG
jgi:hypothetical protein